MSWLITMHLVLLCSTAFFSLTRLRLFSLYEIVAGETEGVRSAAPARALAAPAPPRLTRRPAAQPVLQRICRVPLRAGDGQHLPLARARGAAPARERARSRRAGCRGEQSPLDASTSVPSRLHADYYGVHLAFTPTIAHPRARAPGAGARDGVGGADRLRDHVPPPLVLSEHAASLTPY